MLALGQNGGAMTAAALVHQLKAFVGGARARSFESLALDVFALQFERLASYRRLCEARGMTPATVRDWRRVPLVPTSAFKTVALHVEAGQETFRSSGTQGERSVHHHPFPDLYRATIDVAFPRFCLPAAGTRVNMLSLIPTRDLVADSSLGFMVDHVLSRWGGPESLTAFGARGLEAAKTRTWLGARQRERAPCLILGTSFALADLLAALSRLDLRFRLPASSVVFDTGGFKGRIADVSPERLLDEIATRLGVPSQRVVREYGMTELTGQCYTGALHGGDRDVFLTPPWMRARVLDPETLDEVADGQIGVLAIFDLSNVGSAAHLLTQDLAAADAAGFRLAGRAAEAELRGCSLTAEDLKEKLAG